MTEINGDELIVSYLQCDEASYTCQEGTPPEIEDYLQPCGLTLDDMEGSPGFGVTKAEQCGQDLCMFQYNAEQSCLSQGCTAPCTKDQDCPRGSTCELGSDDQPSYCKPHALELSCP